MYDQAIYSLVIKLGRYLSLVCYEAGFVDKSNYSEKIWEMCLSPFYWDLNND